MADENNGAPPAPVAGTPAPADTATTQTASSVADPANPSKQDWAQFKKDQRDLLASFQAIAEGLKATTGGRTAPVEKPAAASAPTPTTADAALVERIAGLERTATLKGVYADLGIKPGPQRDFIEAATKGMSHDSIPTFVESYLKTLPAPVNAAANAVASPAPVKAPVATGAPGVNGAPSDPGDLSAMDPAVFASLPREERAKRVAEYRARGSNSNPYASQRVRDLTRGGK